MQEVRWSGPLGGLLDLVLLHKQPLYASKVLTNLLRQQHKYKRPWTLPNMHYLLIETNTLDKVGLAALCVFLDCSCIALLQSSVTVYNIQFSTEQPTRVPPHGAASVMLQHPAPHFLAGTAAR
jgi:hypothetical protein